MDGRTQRLMECLAQLEADVVELRRTVLAAPTRPAAPPRVAAQDPPPPTAEQRPAARQRSHQAVPPRRPRHTDIEDSLVGTWFARLGALAVLIGAAFAFKYGVDRELIGPTLRVLAGVLAGFGFLAWGEYARRRSWPAFAQAVSAGGIGLLYLSLLAGHHLYDLMGPVATFSLLTVVSALAAGVALRHEAQALAVLATLGMFLNPFVIGFNDVGGETVLAYVLAVDVAVLVLAAVRRWPVLDWLAFAATWITAAFSVAPTPATPGIVSAAAFFALFMGRTYLRAMQGEGTSPRDLAMTATNATLFFGVGLAHLGEPWWGGFALIVAAVHMGVGLLARATVDRDRPLRLTAFGLTAALVAVAAWLQLDGPWVATAWAAEGAMLVWVGRAVEERGMRGGGLLLLLGALFLSMVIEFQLGADYAPERVLLSPESLTLAVLVGALYLVGSRLQDAPPRDWEGMVRRGAPLLASLLTVVWLSLEAVAAFHRLAPGNDQAVLFTLSAIWAVYGIGVVAAGVAIRHRGARLFGVALLGVTIAKVALVDLWGLELLYRTLAFGGLGLVLLLCSLMYQRFRALIMEGTPR